MSERLERVFREVFDDESLRLTSDLSPETFPAWDSLSHVRLIMALEAEFDTKFTTDEVIDAGSGGSIQMLLQNKNVL
jgi:acyl carrier protein